MLHHYGIMTLHIHNYKRQHNRTYRHTSLCFNRSACTHVWLWCCPCRIMLLVFIPILMYMYICIYIYIYIWVYIYIYIHIHTHTNTSHSYIRMHAFINRALQHVSNHLQQRGNITSCSQCSLYSHREGFSESLIACDEQTPYNPDLGLLNPPYKNNIKNRLGLKDTVIYVTFKKCICFLYYFFFFIKGV